MRCSTILLVAAHKPEELPDLKSTQPCFQTTRISLYYCTILSTHFQDDPNDKLSMHVLGIVEFPAANAMAAESLDGVTSLQSALCGVLDLVLQVILIN